MMARGEFGAVVGTPRLLELYKKYDVKTTWFTPGPYDRHVPGHLQADPGGRPRVRPPRLLPREPYEDRARDRASPDRAGIGHVRSPARHPPGRLPVSVLGLLGRDARPRRGVRLHLRLEPDGSRPRAVPAAALAGSLGARLRAGQGKPRPRDPGQLVPRRLPAARIRHGYPAGSAGHRYDLPPLEGHLRLRVRACRRTRATRSQSTRRSSARRTTSCSSSA